MRAITDRDRIRLAKDHRAYGYRTIDSIKTWRGLADAPLEVDLEVQVHDGNGPYALPFPCRLTQYGWINSRTGGPLAHPVVGWRARGW